MPHPKNWLGISMKMDSQNFDVNSLRVASPCSVGWESMTGDERTRHCHLCRLNVYNTAEMTRKEVESLMRNRDGRLCIRLYRRSDGTVLTKDCPVGLRAVRKRVSKFVSAAFATILSFWSISYSQDKDSDAKRDSSTNAVRMYVENEENELSGTVSDPNGASVPGAAIKLYKNKDKEPLKVEADSDGVFSFRNLEEGTYKIEVTSHGFKKATQNNVVILKGKKTELKITLEVAGDIVVVGIFSEQPLIDTTSTVIETVITHRRIRSLPH